MKKLKKVIPIVIAFIIGISTTVGAATVFNSKDITYSSDKTLVTNVKDSLDELYNKVGKCPDGWYCHTVPTTIADNVELGDYIKMTPTSTSYTISKDLTGYDKDQTINPSELNIWRVIKKNDDGTVDMVSDKISSVSVTFYGQLGFMNFIGGLNTIAAQYTDGKHIKSTRHMGYSNQIEICSNIEICITDTGYENDVTLVENALGTLKPNSEWGSSLAHWLASRFIGIAEGFEGRLYGRVISGSGVLNIQNAFWYPGANSWERSGSGQVRPILTLKEDIKITSGDGKSAETAYELG